MEETTNLVPPELEVKKLPITEIKPASYNPRKIQPSKYKKLKSSIEKVGILQPLIINADGTIIGGNQRYAIAMELDLKTLPVVQVDVPKEEEMLLNIQLNNLTGENDKEKLIDVMGKLFKFESLDLEMSGFRFDEIEKMLSNGQDEEDEDEPEYPITPYFSEKYDYVVIITKNDIDKTYLHNALQLKREKSYKSTAIGLGRALSFEDFQKVWENRDDES